MQHYLGGEMAEFCKTLPNQGKSAFQTRTCRCLKIYRIGPGSLNSDNFCCGPFSSPCRCYLSNKKFRTLCRPHTHTISTWSVCKALYVSQKWAHTTVPNFFGSGKCLCGIGEGGVWIAHLSLDSVHNLTQAHAHSAGHTHTILTCNFNMEFL